MRSRRAALLTALALLCAGGCSRPDPLERARALQQAGNYEESIEPLRELVDSRSGCAEAAYRYGAALAKTGLVTQSFWALREAMRDPDWFVRAGFLLAEGAIRSGNPDLAIETLGEVLEREPEHADSLALRCRARLQSRRDYQGALEDADKLLALHPDQRDILPLRVVALLGLERIDEAGAVLETLEQVQLEAGGAGTGVAAVSCAARAKFKREGGDLESAEKLYSECLERYPSDMVVVSDALDFFEQRHRPDRIEEILKAASKAAPDDRYFRVTLATLYERRGDSSAAEALLEAATESGQDLQAWRDLGGFLMEIGRKEEGLSAWRQAMALAKGPDPELHFAFGEALLSGGRADEAHQIAEALEPGPYREFLLGRIALSGHDYAGALAHLGEGNRLWPDNAVARFYTATAAEGTGDFARAVEEYHAALRSDPNAADTRARLARLHLAAGEALDALYALNYQGTVEEPVQRSVPLLLLELEARAALGELKGRAPKTMEPFLRDPGNWGSAVAAIARGVRRRAGPQAAADVVLRADRMDLTRLSNAPALRSLVGDLSALGKHAEAIRLAEKAAAADPAAEFQEILGQALAAGGRGGDAAAAFERALALETGRPRALLGLARIAESRGDKTEALACYGRIDESRLEDGEPLVAWAALLASLGRTGEASDRLRSALEREATDGPAALALAGLEGEGAPAREERIALARRALLFGQGQAARTLLERLGAG